MTATLPEAEVRETVAPVLPDLQPAELDIAAGGRDTSPPESSVARVSPGLTVLASALACAAAAVMLAGAYKGYVAYLAAFGGVGVGAVSSYLSYRTSRPAALQYLSLPFALVVGAALMAPDAATGTASFGNLVLDAVRRGGLEQPPIPMDPGWRLILVVLFALLTTGTSALAVSLNKAKLSTVIAGPLAMLCGLVQPPGRELASTVAALVLLIAAFAVSYSAELAGLASLTAGFELRRLLRSAAFAGVLGVLVVALAQAGALFPQSQTSHVIPPRKPTTPPPQKDRELFHVDGQLSNRPMRTGVLDGYDLSSGDFLFPPYDSARLRKVDDSGDLPVDPKPSGTTTQIKIVLDDIGGHAVPTLAGASRVEGAGTDLDYDPRSGTLQTSSKPVHAGLSYTLTVPPIPTGATLASAPAAPPAYAEFLRVPPAPAEVTALLSTYGEQAAKNAEPVNGFDRLQFLRAALYSKVVASGAGKPGPLTVADVASMLKGGDASPYQINAAEALLARWAGVPSRLGFGYYGGSPEGDGTKVFRPKDGAAWLEVYFPGSGWVPIVGVPPQARASTSTDVKNENPAVRATDDLALVVYTPVKVTGFLLLFQYVRYYLVRVLALALLLGLLWLAYPVLLKVLRARRRHRWAHGQPFAQQIAVRYVEFRDRMRDAAIGDPSTTPMEFLAYIEDDDEHKELAWLVTRALWGDLARDLRQSDVDAAHDLARSVGGRTMRAQAFPLRVAAAVSRASLREPYTGEVPNLWPRLPVKRTVGSATQTLTALLTSPFRLAARLVPGRA